MSKTNKINTCSDPLVVVILFPKVERFVKEVHEEEGGYGYREILPVVEVCSLETLLRSGCLETDIGHGEI